MEKPYADLTTEGTHRGDVDAKHSGMNVRAPQPEDVTASGSPVKRTFRYSQNEESGARRIAWQAEGDVPTPDEGYTPMGSFTSMDELGQKFAWMHESRNRYAVFENSETGERKMLNETDLSGDWTAGGQYDRVTVFDDENAAAAFVDKG